MNQERFAGGGVDFADMQGLVRFGYAKLTEASFLLLRVRDAAAARRWLAAAPVATAEYQTAPPETALQVALSAEGLRALGLSEEILGGFSAEFLGGLSGDASRSRRLGDIAVNAPDRWAWGAPNQVPHLALLLYARPGGLDAWTEAIRGAAWDAAFEQIGSLSTTDLGGFEHFGFRDGVSQPTPDWDRRREEAVEPLQHELLGEELSYGNLVSLGEFLLGYPNEYGKYTDRPLIAATASGAPGLPEAEDVPAMRDLGRNGSYLVLRTLAQDVRGFWQFAAGHAGAIGGTAQSLAELLVGRTQKGDPLVPLEDHGISGIGAKDAALNQFTYDGDPKGTHCPFAAHIRRANPRNSDLPDAENSILSKLIRTLGFGESAYNADVISSTRFHRVLRRGREYGPRLDAEAALQPAPPDDPERGIHFLSLGANISRQFEFVQGAWLNNSKFGGLTEEGDAIVGNRQAIPGCPITGSFSIPQAAGAAQRLNDLPQFVTVRGGAYFFLPGIRALRYLAGL